MNLGTALAQCDARLDVRAMPALAIRPEATEIIRGALELLVEAAGSARGDVSVSAWESAGSEVVLVMQMRVADGPDASCPLWPDGPGAMGLAARTGCRIALHRDQTVTTVGLWLKSNQHASDCQTPCGGIE